MSPSCERRRVSYTVSDSMVCIRRERVQVPCAELARRIERTDSLGDCLTVQQFTPTATRQDLISRTPHTPDCHRDRHRDHPPAGLDPHHCPLRRAPAAQTARRWSRRRGGCETESEASAPGNVRARPGTNGRAASDLDPFRDGAFGPTESDSKRGMWRGERVPGNAINYLLSVSYCLSISEFQTPPPGRGVCGMTPAALLLLDHARSRGGEGRHLLRTALVDQRVTASPGELAVGARLLALLGERDQGDAAEAEFAAAAADEGPLDPASRPGGLDEKVQAVAVTMPVAGRVYQQNHLHENERAILRYSKRAHV